MPKKGELDKNASERSKYQREYNSKPEQKKRRAERNATRAIMMADGRVSKNDGNDVDHKDHDTSNTKKSNLSVMKASINRAKNRKPTT